MRLRIIEFELRRARQAQAEEFMAKRMGATVVKVPVSHASLVSRPKEVVELIIAAAEPAGN